jgi:hypothetical protein
MSEAIVNIGVFNDNRAAFHFGIKMWRGRAPATIYLKRDGPKPVEAVGCGLAIWGNKGLTPEFVDLPRMAAVIPMNRPTGVNHHMNWETLTHAEMGSIGIPPVRR